MAKKKNDFKIGDIIGFWEVVEVPLKGRNIKCICIGCHITQKWVDTVNLRRGRSKSCGCQNTDLAKETSIKNYGVEHYLQTKEGKERHKATCLEKYGEDNVSKVPKFKQQKIDTCLKNFGAQWPQQVLEIREKSKQAMLETYGVEKPLQLEYFQKIYKDTCKERYGVSNFSKTDQYKDKYTTTSLAKFGFEHPSQSSEIRLKTENTLLSTYGTKNFIKAWNMQNSVCHSIGELELLEWVRQWYPSAKSYRKGKFELDIFIPELNMGIEYNGLYTHSENGIKRRGYKGIVKNYHLDKTKYFIDNKIRTIHIWDYEWNKKKDKVKSYLLSVLGKNEYKVGARKCKLIWSDSKDEIKKAHDLLDSTHIQGNTNSTKYVANVYYNDELLATATFGRHHRDSKTWVLSRFTTKTNYTIQGILSKISKLAFKELQSDIISWADYRLSTGNGYEKAGWKFEKLLPPDYFYSANNNKVISKQSRQKKIVNTPQGMTETEHAKLDKLNKVWDCGKIRFRFNC